MAEKVLVAYASKYGSTAQIAVRVGDILRTDGLDVTVSQADRVGDLSVYTAVIIGSAVYMGRWRKQAVKFLRANEEALASKNVWLFSSGPTEEGESEDLVNEWTFPKNVQQMASCIQPHDIEVFHGVLDAEKLYFFERFMIKNAKAPFGDLRDWDDINGWAGYIADVLNGVIDESDEMDDVQDSDDNELDSNTKP